jgi:LacI family transcriptional regulator/LacI family repressor for deo operon, udp, cdd, tsx, nupC, and nupG
MSRTVSIEDIAQAAGVSHTTVSRALRDSPLISREVRERVQKLAYEMGYIPNALAQGLRGKRTNTIGLVVTTIADPFFGRVVRGVEEIAQQRSISLFLSVSYNDPESELAVIETFHRRRVDGIIVAAAQLTALQEKRLSRIPVPTVLINQQTETNLEHLHSVSIDDYAGAQQAIRFLLDQGHRAIGFLGAGNRPRSNRLRLQGYRDMLSAAGFEPRPDWVRGTPSGSRYHTDDVRGAQELLPDLLNAGVTAVFCFNDMMAVGALLACRTLGIAVPEQISIVGFDDIEVAQFVTPALTTVHQPKLRLGRTAITMLLDLLDGKPVVDACLPAELIVRGSAAVPPPVPVRDLRPGIGAVQPDQFFDPS